MVEQTRPDLFTDDSARNETVVAEGVSFENFLKLYAEQHAEWLMGKVILIVTNNLHHQSIQGFLHSLLNYYLGLKKLGRIFTAGVSMYISDNQPARQPDLLIVLNEHRDRLKANYVAGPADIAIEIVSPESSKRDRGDKVDEYEAAGVQEYWLFDPLRRDAVIYELGAEGRYHVRPLDSRGRITSHVLSGFALDPAILWQDEHPAGPEMVALVEQMTSNAG